MKIDLDALQAKAKAATDGPWKWDGPARLTLRSPSGYRVIELRDGFCAAQDPEYIAAASPDVVLALIDRIRELEDHVAMRQKMLDGLLK